ncbi:hypothetical protein HK103_006497 [Boothiomyces macroporosus]|uniref:Translation machinery-associated protein 16 n=1 Tax=Boothiomyces macroporosus TaxID=261099 RepID=A0AAD5UNB9_9FUNG|nr:hypothetical protein HK103_006497 [Boothiomyces macroporosus]
MGTTNNKKKTLKNIKGLDKAHPYSRKASQMKRAILRTSTMSTKDSLRQEPKQRVVDKLLWFKEKADDVLTLDQLREVIEEYINRNMEEIMELKKNWRQGRPKPNRLDLLENLHSKEMQDFKLGFEVPDLTNKDVIDYYKVWKGDYNAISDIKIVRVKQTADSGENDSVMKDDQ